MKIALLDETAIEAIKTGDQEIESALSNPDMPLVIPDLNILNDANIAPEILSKIFSAILQRIPKIVTVESLISPSDTGGREYSKIFLYYTLDITVPPFNEDAHKFAKPLIPELCRTCKMDFIPQLKDFLKTYLLTEIEKCIAFDAASESDHMKLYRSFGMRTMYLDRWFQLYGELLDTWDEGIAFVQKNDRLFSKFKQAFPNRHESNKFNIFVHFYNAKKIKPSTFKTQLSIAEFMDLYKITDGWPASDVNFRTEDLLIAQKYNFEQKLELIEALRNTPEAYYKKWAGNAVGLSLTSEEFLVFLQNHIKTEADIERYAFILKGFLGQDEVKKAVDTHLFYAVLSALHFRSIERDIKNQEQIIRFNKIFQDTLGAEHPLALAAKQLLLKKRNLNDRDERLIASNIISWIIEVAKFIAFEVDYQKIIANNQELHTQFLVSLTNYPDKEFRKRLTEIYFAICKSEESLNTFVELAKDQPERMYMTALLLTQLCHNKPELKQEILTNILPNISQAYKDNNMLNIMLGSINEMQKSQQLTAEELLSVIRKVLKPQIVVVTKAIEDDNLQIIMQQAKLQIAQTIASEPEAVVVVPYILDAKEQVAISYIKRGNRKLIFGEDIKKYKNLSERIFKFIKDKRKVVQNTASMLNENKIIHRKDRESNLWLSLGGLAQYKALRSVFSKTTTSSIDEATTNATVDLLGLPDDAKVKAALERNILRKHNSAALLAYQAGLKTLSDGGKYTALLAEFVSQIVTPIAELFYKNRYDITDNPHMQRIKQHSDINERWRKNYTVNLKILNRKFNIKDNPEPKVFDIKAFIHDKIVIHGHLPNAGVFAILYDYLASNSYPERGELIAQLDKEYINAPNYDLVKRILDLYNSSPSPLAQLGNDIAEIIKLISPELEFSNDLQALLNQSNFKPESQVKKYEDYTLQFTDDYWKLLMSGTDVDGSCQRIPGSASYNKCLIGGYVMSPHVKLLAIVTPDNKIAMRAILRLCFDEVLQKPVLHMEAIYSAAGTPDYFKQSLETFAKLCGMKLECDVVMSKDNMPDAKQYPNPITVSTVKGAEYVDALGGPQEKAYSLKNTIQLYSHADFTKRPVNERIKLWEMKRLQTREKQAVKPESSPSSRPRNKSF